MNTRILTSAADVSRPDRYPVRVYAFTKPGSRDRVSCAQVSDAGAPYSAVLIPPSAARQQIVSHNNNNNNNNNNNDNDKHRLKGRLLRSFHGESFQSQSLSAPSKENLR